MKTYKI